MLKHKSLFSLAMIAALSLTSCASPSSTAAPEGTSKEAGTLGTRICITNATTLPMTAAPSQRVVRKNADHIVGSAGALSDTSPLCFAGWNSYLQNVWSGADDFNPGKWSTIEQDVSISIGIDGNYNVLNFRANNEPIYKPSLNWITNTESPIQWSGDRMPEGETLEGNAAGHQFTVTRVSDSEFYKEFTVRFTK